MLRCICFDWGGTLMSEDGPQDRAMALWPRVEAMPGAHAVLAALGARWPLHIATNASVSTRPLIALALQRAGLLAHFQHIFCFTEIGARKDQAAFWQVVQATTGVPLQQTAMVGDSLEQDVLGPARLGVRTVWFNAGGARPAPQPAVAEVHSLAALLPCFLGPSHAPR
ncbi:MAG: HAD family hydrolase [Pseudorhodoferax sp.]